MPGVDPPAKVLPLAQAEDVVRIRQAVRAEATSAGFSLVDQTKLVTAASELGRNTLRHGGGGSVRLTWIRVGQRIGLELVFVDGGPGIADLDQAMKDGFSSVGGLGLGLGGSKRLVNEFEIGPNPSGGTVVRVVKWK